MRGFSAIGFDRIKSEGNFGGVIRAAHCYRVALIAVAGDRLDAERIVNCPMNNTRGERHIPTLIGDLKQCLPFGCVPVAVDLIDGAVELQNYQHPQRAFYLFGPEDGTLAPEIVDWCQDKIYIPTRLCMNLAATVNVVLYDRLAKQLIDAKRDRKRQTAILK